VRKDGRVIWVQVTASMIHDASGKPVRSAGILEDITERKHAEEQLRKAVDDLKRSNADLERFAYVSSHDLQEPLRTIRSFLQLLEKRYRDRLDSDADDFIAFTTDAAARMQALIQDLLAFSRVGTQGQPLTPTRADEALEDALASLRGAIAETEARIVREPLPVVQGDRGQLAQLFQNLIGNAIKFRREGVPVEVRISARRDPREKGCWVFRVADNGIGIDPKYHEKVFTIFQRLHTSEHYKGSGVGLAICKRIVERHGGRIWIESQEGEGSAFYFTLPRA
jgi:light-regulated signal transduction histidine kinase (bacteriophytochrome)